MKEKKAIVYENGWEDACPLGSGREEQIVVSGNHFEYRYDQSLITQQHGRRDPWEYICVIIVSICTSLSNSKKKKKVSSRICLSIIPHRAKWQYEERTRIRKRSLMESPYSPGSHAHIIQTSPQARFFCDTAVLQGQANKQTTNIFTTATQPPGAEPPPMQ